MAAGLGLEVDRARVLTVTPYIARLAEQEDVEARVDEEPKHEVTPDTTPDAAPADEDEGNGE